jgi:thioredoxin-like negative regulator of GroEL
VLAALLLLAPATESLAKKKPEKKQEVDYLGLAAVLIRDGHMDRAAAVLSDVNTEDEKLDRAQYHTLYAIIWLKQRTYLKAKEHALAAIKEGKQGGEIHLLLGQAYFGMKKYRPALKAFSAAGPAARKQPGIYLLRAQCHWRLKQKQQAWQVLQAGLKRYPRHEQMRQQKILLLVDLKLYQQAIAEGSRFLAGKDARAHDYVAMAEVFRQSKQHRRAIRLLEQALLRFPDDEKLRVQLARSYLDLKQPFAAAGLLHQASLQNTRLTVEAAELYRRAGKLLRALHLNAQVQDQKQKIRQRLGLLIELKRFEEAAAMEPRLVRLGLTKEQRLTYALAYALYRTGRSKRCEHWLRQITEPKLFRKAMELRRAIDACAREGGPQCQ